MRSLLAAGLGVVLSLSFVIPVLAADVPTLSGTITDNVGTLAGSEGTIEVAVAQLKAERDITMYVVWLQSLDGEDPGAFVERIADQNSLRGGRNVILMVSMSDRKDAVWSSGSTAITVSELTLIRTDTVEPQLAAGKFADAVVAAAQGFATADATVVQPPQQPTGPSAAPSVPIDWSPILRVFAILLLATLVVVVGYFIFVWYRNRTAVQRQAKAEAERLEALSKKARRELIGGDEAIRDAEQNYAFAEAQFGAPEVVALKSAIESAKGLMQEAFKVGQLIDDEIVEPYDERMTMFGGIVNRTDDANALIAKAMAHVEGLRAIEKRAADSIKQLMAGSKGRAKAIGDAQVALNRIQAHGASAYPSVAHNVDVAAKNDELGKQYLAEAEAFLDKGDRPKAALALRSAEEALAKGLNSLTAIDKLSESLSMAEKNLSAEIAEAEAEVANAQAHIESTNVPGFDSILRLAREALSAAKRESDRENADFLLAYKQATEANVYADQVLDGIREKQERARRAIEQAKATVRTAQASITQANSYIESHRTTVGRKARNRLSEAQRQYEEAARNTDIFVAAAAAVSANQYAEDAYRIARNEVSAAASSAGSYSSSSSGSHSSSSSGSYGSRSSSSNDSWGGGGISIGSFGGGGGGSSGGGW